MSKLNFGKLKKWQIDEMSSWPNGKLANIGEMMKLHVDKMAS
jgi:hypothetical protein